MDKKWLCAPYILPQFDPNFRRLETLIDLSSCIETLSHTSFFGDVIPCLIRRYYEYLIKRRWTITTQQRASCIRKSDWEMLLSSDLCFSTPEIVIHVNWEVSPSLCGSGYHPCILGSKWIASHSNSRKMKSNESRLELLQTPSHNSPSNWPSQSIDEYDWRLVKYIFLVTAKYLIRR